MLVTQDTAGGLNGNVISYYADKPWGFTSAEKSTLFAMPEATVMLGNARPGHLGVHPTADAAPQHER